MAHQGNISRLTQMQMRFQQKQQIEKDQKRSEMAGSKGFIPINESKKLSTTLGAGKVRQMFDERRQRSTGIDKSYPLQPISLTNGSKPKSTHLTANNNNSIPNKKLDTDSRLINDRLKDSSSSCIDDLDNANNNLIGSNQASKIHKQMNSTAAVRLRPLTEVKPNENANKPLNVKVKQSPMKANVKSPIQQLESITRPPTNKVPFRSTKTPISSASSIKSDNMTSSNLSSPVSRKSDTGENCCRYCDRRFAEDRLEKHESICQKTSMKKRKIFDTTKHRIQGTEAEQFLKKTSKISNKKQTEQVAIGPKKNDWRRKHEEFVAAIRNAKELKTHLARGGKLSDLPPPPPSENPDYVQCPHCMRRFNQSAAERHIPKCASFKHNKPKPKPASRSKY